MGNVPFRKKHESDTQPKLCRYSKQSEPTIFSVSCVNNDPQISTVRNWNWEKDDDDVSYMSIHSGYSFSIPSESSDSAFGDKISLSSSVTDISLRTKHLVRKDDDAVSKSSWTQPKYIQQEKHDDRGFTTHSKQISYMIEAFQPLIEKSVCVKQLLPSLFTFIDARDVDEIYRTETRSSSKAVEKLISCLKKSKAKGKWQALVEAMDSAGYEYIVKLLKGKTEEDFTVHTQLLRIFTPNIFRRIHPKQFIDLLYEKNIIDETDKDEIESKEKQSGPSAASLMILDKIPRKHSNWFRVFQEVLEQCGHGDVNAHFESLNTTVDANSADYIPKYQLCRPRLSTPHKKPSRFNSTYALQPNNIHSDIAINERSASQTLLNKHKSLAEIEMTPDEEIQHLNQEEERLNQQIYLQQKRKDVYKLRRQLEILKEEEMDEDHYQRPWDTNDATLRMCPIDKEMHGELESPEEIYEEFPDSIEDSYCRDTIENHDSLIQNEVGVCGTSSTEACPDIDDIAVPESDTINKLPDFDHNELNGVHACKDTNQSCITELQTGTRPINETFLPGQVIDFGDEENYDFDEIDEFPYINQDADEQIIIKNNHASTITKRCSCKEKMFEQHKEHIETYIKQSLESTTETIKHHLSKEIQQLNSAIPRGNTYGSYGNYGISANYINIEPFHRVPLYDVRSNTDSFAYLSNNLKYNFNSYFDEKVPSCTNSHKELSCM